MGIYIDQPGDFTVYDVPKAGGTTVRAWVSYLATGRLQLQGSKAYYYGNAVHAAVLRDLGYQLDWFREVPGERVCIKRDPVERFISCYEDKVLKEKRIQAISLDELLDKFDDIINSIDKPHPSNPKIGYLRYHFAPQTWQLGYSRTYYDHIFGMEELNSHARQYLEDKWSVKLPDLHCRNNSNKSIKLSKPQIEKLHSIYKHDFDVGWC